MSVTHASTHPRLPLSSPSFVRPLPSPLLLPHPHPPLPSPLSVQQTNDPFDPSQSSTARALQCSDPRCRFPDKTVKILNCLGPRQAGAGNATSAASSSLPAGAASCDYSVAYSDGSGSSGRLLGDVLHLPVTGSLGMAGIPVTFG